MLGIKSIISSRKQAVVEQLYEIHSLLCVCGSIFTRWHQAYLNLDVATEFVSFIEQAWNNTERKKDLTR